MSECDKELAHWRGSERTATLVREEIRNRWGEKAAAEYDPEVNCFTLKTWNAKGYRVKKGEKAIQSVGLSVEERETKDGDVEKVARRVPTKLFYITQVEQGSPRKQKANGSAPKLDYADLEELLRYVSAEVLGLIEMDLPEDEAQDSDLERERREELYDLANRIGEWHVKIKELAAA